MKTRENQIFFMVIFCKRERERERERDQLTMNNIIYSNWLISPTYFLWYHVLKGFLNKLIAYSFPGFSKPKLIIGHFNVQTIILMPVLVIIDEE